MRPLMASENGDVHTSSEVITMVDNLRLRQPQDPKQINVHEAWEVEYWTNKWGITRAQLVAAVNAVGTQTVRVAAHLGKRP